MTTPTDKLVADFAPLLYLEAGILDDKRLAAFLMRAGSHIEHQAAALVAAEDEIARLNRGLDEGIVRLRAIQAVVGSSSWVTA